MTKLESGKPRLGLHIARAMEVLVEFGRLDPDDAYQALLLSLVPSTGFSVTLQRAVYTGRDRGFPG